MKNMTPRKAEMWTAIILALVPLLLLIGAMSGNETVELLALIPFFAGLIFFITFYRCPSCGEFLGRNRGPYCHQCGEKFRETDDKW